MCPPGFAAFATLLGPQSSLVFRSSLCLYFTPSTRYNAPIDLKLALNWDGVETFICGFAIYKPTEELQKQSTGACRGGGGGGGELA